MKNYIQHSVKVMIAVAFIALGSACKKSDSPEPPKPEDGKVSIENPALVTALKEQGFTFEGNTLVVNDKVRTTTLLNLSGKQLTDVKGLDAFPALSEVNLSNNKFAQTFDFGILPATVKSVNLSGNELYDFKNLATTDYSDNAQEPYKLIRSFDKIVLPTTAKYNMDVLPAYVKLAPKSDVQMLNAQGTAEKYTTLREVPDPVLLQYLKANFASVFEGNKIDISKSIKVDERANAVKILKGEEGYNEPEFANLKNLEGVEYIINSPLFSGSVEVWLLANENFNLPKLKISKKTASVKLINLTTSVLDLSEAENLSQIVSIGNKEVKDIDVSSTKIMKRGTIGYDGFAGDYLFFSKCPNLENIVFPNLSKGVVTPTVVGLFGLLELPKLKSAVDISKIEAAGIIELAGLPLVPKITYPNEIKYFSYEELDGEEPEFPGQLNFDIGRDIFDRAETKAFINKYLPKERLYFFGGIGEFSKDIEFYDYTATENKSGRNIIRKTKGYTLKDLAESNRAKRKK